MKLENKKEISFLIVLRLPWKGRLILRLVLEKDQNASNDFF